MAVVRRRLRDALVGLCMLALALLIIAKLEQEASIDLGGPFQVVDGDTLSSNGNRLRLLGIDAPELGQQCISGQGSYDCGVSARDGLAAMLDRADWVCEGGRQDKYRRLLVRCASGRTDLAEELARRGLVVAEDDSPEKNIDAQMRDTEIEQAKSFYYFCVLQNYNYVLQAFHALI